MRRWQRVCPGQKGGMDSMTQNEIKFANLLGKIMLVIGGLGAVATIALRIWIFPGMINSGNGELDSPWTVMGFMLLCILALVALGFFTSGIRREVSGGSCILLAGGMLAAALVLLIAEGDDLLSAYQNGETMHIIQGALGVLSAVALLLLGRRLLVEGSTRRGISQWSMLLPVLWMWLRIVNYEMSYASLARLEDGFFGFAMLVFELMFLFKLARYTAGVGQVRTGSIFFYSAATMLFALSSPVVKIIVHMVDDGMSVQAFDLAGASDLAVGFLALLVGITYLRGTEPLAPDEPSEEEVYPVEGELIFAGEDDSEESVD